MAQVTDHARPPGQVQEQRRRHLQTHLALHLDDHRDGMITLVVNSLSDAQQIRDHSELIRDAYRFNPFL